MVLEIKDLDKSFGRKKVLSSLNHSFEHGTYGLLGPNGAGKTTLIRCITQLYPPKSGSILFHGKPIEQDKSYMDKIGYLPQKFGLFKELTVLEMMEMMGELKNMPKGEIRSRAESCVELVNLQDRLKSKVKTLSGGMIRRLGIAQAILNDPELIIFDEPTAGLDPEERLRFKNIISEIKGNRTIIISTHIVEDVETLCDSVSIMKDGFVAASGSCREIQQFAENKVFDIPKNNIDKLLGEYHIHRQFERDGVNMVQVLTKEKQDNANAVRPTVEDGYICVLKNI